MGTMDPIASQRLREHLDLTMRAAQHAEKVLRSTDIGDEDAADGMTQLIDEVAKKHDMVRHEMGQLGVTVPISQTAGLSEALTTGAGTSAGRRMQFERQIVDIKEACVQLKEMMEYEDNVEGYDNIEDAATSVSGGRGVGGGYKDVDSATTLSQIHEDQDDSDDEDSKNIMTPRGVYVQRCLPISKAEVSNEMESFTTWIRMTRVDLIGLLIFLIYILTGGAYILARIVYSLDGLGSELWYGAIVLSAEILSILSLIFYGIWLCAKTNNDDMKVKSFDSDKMRRLYVVRVFILCKGESLSLVRRTIASVRNAYMPDGCELKLYLLDEARDNSKRDFFMGVKNGTDVIYVTPPVKSGDSKVANWRSEIMNFALSLIYPTADSEGRKNISASELVCVVTADQTCSSSFFVNLLRYIDSGDDIAAAICPRICYNVDGDCDVFDAQKVAYCERMQLGMDAYGFTAMMHTNMLLRARALQEVNWFPTHTLAENWELGMLLRSFGWKSRYVPEYSAIGEAPEEICDAVDAHYRHSRGYFQTFWSYQCPLLQRDLGLFYRLMYASRCFQAFASGMWTIIFTLVPIVHLIFGYFPVNFTVHVVVTMMAHYLVRIVMLLYCDSLKQMRALWFSRVAVSICWWYDFKASLLIPLKAAIGPGTSFRSRSWSDLAPARNIKALRWPFVLLILSIIAFIGGCVHLREVINLPTVLSLCLIVINIAPPLLIISYWNFGQGMLLTRLSTLLMVLSGIAAAAAFTFLWLLYPRDVDFARAARLSLRFLNAERSGVISGGYPIDWRSSSGLQYAEVNMTFTNVTKGVVTDKTDFFFKQVDLSGGFYNDGEIGAVKLTWNIAVTTSMLAWSMLEYPGFWGQSLELQNDISSILMHGALYMQEIYVVTPLQDPLNPGRLMSSSNDQIIYVVGNLQEERQEWRRPEDVTRFAGMDYDIGYMLLDESPSDLAGQVVAAITAGAIALQTYEVIERAVAKTMVDKAHRLFQSAMFSPGLYTEGFNGTEASFGIEDHYPSSEFGDDLFWASTWLYRASTNNIRTFNISYYREAMATTMALAYGELDLPGVSWDYMNNIAVTHAATITQEVRYHLAAQSFIWDWICNTELVKYTRNGRAYFFDTPHLGSTAGAAAMAAVYVHKNRDWNFVSENEALVKSFQCFASEQARYLLGGQVTGIVRHKPFMIGYDDRTFTRTWHRGASCPTNGECSVRVALEDDPDQNSIDGALLWNPIFEDFPKDVRGRNTTVVSLENNFAVPMLFAAVDTQAVGYSECMNVKGTAFMKSRMCRKGRPNDFRLGPLEDVGRVKPEFEGLYKPKENPDDRIPPPPPPVERPLVTNRAPE